MLINLSDLINNSRIPSTGVLLRSGCSHHGTINISCSACCASGIGPKQTDDQIDSYSGTSLFVGWVID